MAASTGEDLTSPVWQAEPVEAAMAGHRARSSGPDWPTKETNNVFGNRDEEAPCKTMLAPSAACRRCQNSSVSLLTVAFIDGRDSRARSQASPSAAIIGTASVPARRP